MFWCGGYYVGRQKSRNTFEELETTHIATGSNVVTGGYSKSICTPRLIHIKAGKGSFLTVKTSSAQTHNKGLFFSVWIKHIGWQSQKPQSCVTIKKVLCVNEHVLVICTKTCLS